MSDKVLYELNGHVATITYNRPEALNAIDRTVRADLNAAFTRFRVVASTTDAAEGSAAARERRPPTWTGA
jgi:enoyl-CoA hydratase/carnithine racemase